ncbi:DUF115 domain-containing protein, partial [Salmonella enterica subsp. enterica]|nr:DUF115 domain-containing protein [Salmonella enterica subsp. enterica]
NNEPIISLEMNGKDYWLHSKYNATAEAENWAVTIKDSLGSSEDVILYGLGLGYYLEAVLRIPNVHRVYVVEPSVEVFVRLIHSRDIRSLLSDKRLKLLAVGSEQNLISEIANQLSSYVATGSLPLVAPPIYQRLFKNTFEMLLGNVKRALMDQVANLQTYQAFQSYWISNILTNLKYTIKSPSVECLRNAYLGITTVIVGSGPSLKEDIHYLRQLKNNCLIIAAGSSIQAFVREGIDPHLVVSMDGGPDNFQAFKNVEIDNVPLLFIPQIKSEILDIYKGQMMHAKF